MVIKTKTTFPHFKQLLKQLKIRIDHALSKTGCRQMSKLFSKTTSKISKYSYVLPALGKPAFFTWVCSGGGGEWGLLKLLFDRVSSVKVELPTFIYEFFSTSKNDWFFKFIFYVFKCCIFLILRGKIVFCLFVCLFVCFSNFPKMGPCLWMCWQNNKTHMFKERIF